MPNVQQRRGTKAALDASTEIPLAGQIYFETDNNCFKVGDGTRRYSELPYLQASTGSIATDALADAAITAIKVATDAIGTDAIVDENITTEKLADNAVTQAKLSSNSVGNAELTGNAVDTAQIRDDAVTSQKIVDDAVTETKILDSAITDNKIRNATITGASIAGSAVGNVNLANDAVHTRNVLDGNVTTPKVADGAITYAKIQDLSAETLLGRTGLAGDGPPVEIHLTDYARGIINQSSAAAIRSVIDVASTTEITSEITSEISTAIANLVDSAPGTLDTLNELAAALGDDANFSTTVTNSIASNTSAIATKMPLAGGTFTGEVIHQRVFYNGYLEVGNNILDAATIASGNGDRSLLNDAATVAKVKEIESARGRRVQGLSIISPPHTSWNNGLNYNTPQDNMHWRWHNNAWEQVSAVNQNWIGQYATVVAQDWGQTLSDDTGTETQFQRILLYEDGTSANIAGLGVSASNFNIGTKGGINFSIYTNGTLRTRYRSNGSVEHSAGTHFFTGLIDASNFVYANGYRAKNAGSATDTAYGKWGGGDTGAYFPSDDEYAISTDGETRMKFRDLSAGSTNKHSDIVVQRSPGRATFKAGTNLDSSGWFIIDSSGSPVALNYFTSNNVSLCHGGGGVVVGTNANPGQYKLTVNGKSYLQNDVKIGSTGQLFIPDGDATDPAICFVNDTNTGIKRNTNGNLDIVTNGYNRLSLTTGGDIHTTSLGTLYVNGNAVFAGTVTITNGMDVSNLAQSSASTGQFLKWDGSAWNPGNTTLNDCTDVTAFPSSGEVLYYNGTNWLGASAATFLSGTNIGDLSNVSSTSPSTGEVLTWNGTSWAPATPTGGSSGSGSSTLAGLTDVTISSAASGEVLYWNGSGWVNQDLQLHAVATTGSYNDLTNKPSYATVATSGSYSDLQNVPTTFQPIAHGHPISSITNLQTELNGKSNTGHGHAQSDITNLVSDLAGKASLVGGKVPASELPSFVDDVLEYNGTSSFPATGETGKIYVDTSTNKTHRWSGSSYVEISASPGSTDSVTEGMTNLYYTDARVDARILNSLLDEDNFSSNSDQAAPTQQSVKAYVDAINSSLSGSIASANASISTNTSNIALKANTSSLDNIAYTGSWNDLNSVPTSFVPSSHSHAQSEITGLVTALAAKANTSSLATVATSGLYSDLTGRVQSINDLSNVSSSSPTAGDILRYDGTNWVEENPELISTINTTTANRAVSLNYNDAQSFVVNMQSSQLHTVTFDNWPTTNPLRVLTATMVMKFPGTGGYATSASVQWPSTVKWPGGTAPTITNKTGATDIFSFVSYDNGASWLGFTGGQEF